MKKLLYLINHEMRMLIKILLIIELSMIGIQSISFMFVISNENNLYLRFEELLEMAQIPIIFFVSFILVLLLNILSYYRYFIGSKSIYTLLTLPQKRRAIYCAKLFAGIISIFSLLASQMLGVLMNYLVFDASGYGMPKVTNALLLAFARSNFLRMIFPMHLFYIMINSVIFISLVVVVIFLAITETAKKHTWMLLPIPWLLCALIFGVWPLYQTEFSLWVILIVTCIMNLIFIKLSIKALNIEKRM